MLKKLLALLLALSLVFCLFACDSGSKNNDDDDDDDEEQVEDKDKDDKDEDKDDKDDKDDEDDKPAKPADDDEDEPAKPVDLSEEILGAWGFETYFTPEDMGMDLDFDKIEIVIVYHFYEDGTVEQYFEENSVMAMGDEMYDLLEDMMYDELDAMGYTEEQFEEETGYTVAAYVEEIVVDMVEELLDQVEEADWELDGNILTIDGAELEIEMDGKNMVVVSGDEDVVETFESMHVELPLEFERID